MNKKNILTLCGSTRTNSTNHRILDAIARRYSKDIDFHSYNLTELPYFNPDMDSDNPPAAVQDFRRRIQAADGVLVCTPEYVFSIPGVLKNALEWMVSTIIFLGKPTALITASSAGQKGHESLLLVLRTIGAAIPNSGELLISGVRAKINAEGEALDEGVAAGISNLMTAFILALEKGEAKA